MKTISDERRTGMADARGLSNGPVNELAEIVLDDGRVVRVKVKKVGPGARMMSFGIGA